jgi:acetolactate synthase-1/2/3 large subunit
VPKTIYSIWTRIILGQGGRIKALLKNQIPAAWTILGLSALPTDHLNVGMLECMELWPNVLTNECDVLIALGMRFDDRVSKFSYLC